MQQPNYTSWQPTPLEQFSERKTYFAFTLQEGMQKIQNELGPRAKIISSRTVPHPQNPNQPILEIIVEAPEVIAPPVEARAESAPIEVGGLDSQMEKIREVVIFPLLYPEMFERLGIDPPRGVLMFGPPGCGKTLIARSLAEECKAYFFTINGPELMGANLGESEKNLRDVFDKAVKQQSAIIFFDEIDAIAVKREESRSGTERRLVTQLLTLMDGITPNTRVIVLAATNLPDEIEPALRRPGRFDREIEINPPDKNGRLEILKIHTRKMALDPDIDLTELAEATHGYVGADLASLCREAGLYAIRESCPSGAFPGPDMLSTLVVNQRHFKHVLKHARPSSLREYAAEHPTVNWEDIGGLEEVKQELQEAVVIPLKQPELFLKMGIRPSKGILLSGPPGTGKTLIARAAASECGVNFITVNGPSLVSKYVGESEKAIRQVFAKARQAKPCIIFFDEFDSVAPVRGTSGESEHANRLVAQFLVELDGFSQGEDVFCLAATNRPDAIDPALLRPGRFDKVIEVPLPDGRSRRKILEVHLRSKPVERNINLDELVDATAGLSGAEIEEVCRRAAMNAVQQVLSGSGPLEPTISQGKLMRAIKKVCESTGKPEPRTSTPRVLVLDDDSVVLEYTAMALRTDGFEDLTFEDPQKALAAIQKERFDLAFLDINMPQMNGFEVLARIRSIQPNLPVVMNTGRHDASSAVQSFRLGAVDYLEKPCSVIDIRKTAWKAIGKSEE